MRAPFGFFTIQAINVPKAKRKVEHHKKMQEKAIDAAARSELLLPSSSGYMEPEGPMDKTYKVTQLDIKEAVDLQSRDKVTCCGDVVDSFQDFLP